MVERTKLFNLRLSALESEMLKALGAEEGASAASLVRRWIRQHYEARFGAPRPQSAAPTKR